MFTLNHQTPATASEDVAKIFSHFTDKGNPVPAPLLLMSASPDLLNLVFNQISYFMKHQTLSFPVLAAIRFLAAQEVCYDHCVKLNTSWLIKTGLTEQDIADLAAGKEAEAFTEGENALLATVNKAIKRQKISQSEIKELRGYGWKDSDILDACMQATSLISSSYLFEAFNKE